MCAGETFVSFGRTGALHRASAEPSESGLKRSRQYQNRAANHEPDDHTCARKAQPQTSRRRRLELLASCLHSCAAT